jgi:hypothetical protein
MKARLAVLAVPGPAHNAPQLLGHQLHTVADAQDGDPRLIKGRVAGRRFLLVDTGGAARKNNSPGPFGLDLINRGRIRKHFTKHLEFPDTPGNQVAVLTTEIKNNDQFLLG